MRIWKPGIAVGVAAAVLAIAAATPWEGATQAATAEDGCLVRRDVPYYQVMPGAAASTPDRYISPRRPIEDPCGMQLLR